MGVSQLKQLIAQSCQEHCSITAFCEKIGISYHTIRKSFNRSEGTSVLEYYQAVRVARAQELLCKSDERIFEVANEMSFANSGNFSNWFKKRTGLSPQRYREQFRQQPSASC